MARSASGTVGTPHWGGWTGHRARATAVSAVAICDSQSRPADHTTARRSDLRPSTVLCETRRFRCQSLAAKHMPCLQDLDAFEFRAQIFTILWRIKTQMSSFSIPKIVLCILMFSIRMHCTSSINLEVNGIDRHFNETCHYDQVLLPDEPSMALCNRFSKEGLLSFYISQYPFYQISFTDNLSIHEYSETQNF